jgi:hypothetical protein
MVCKRHQPPGKVHIPAHQAPPTSVRSPTRLPLLLHQVVRRSVTGTVSHPSRPPHRGHKRMVASGPGQWCPWSAARAGHRRRWSRHGGRRRVRMLVEHLPTQHLYIHCAPHCHLVVGVVDGIECPWRWTITRLPTHAHAHVRGHLQDPDHHLPHCVDQDTQVGTCRHVNERQCLTRLGRTTMIT